MDHDNCKLKLSDLSQLCNLLCLCKRQILDLFPVCNLLINSGCMTSKTTLKSHVISSLHPIINALWLSHLVYR